MNFLKTAAVLNFLKQFIREKLKEIFKSGEYFIGSPALVLDFLELESLENSGFVNGLKCALFSCERESLSDNFGFNYSIENESLALLPKELINDDVLETKLYTLHGDILYSKFSSFKLGRIVKFEADFEVKKNDDLLKIGDLEFKF